MLLYKILLGGFGHCWLEESQSKARAERIASTIVEWSKQVMAESSCGAIKSWVSIFIVEWYWGMKMGTGQNYANVD